jgi:hypothetical protein
MILSLIFYLLLITYLSLPITKGRCEKLNLYLNLNYNYFQSYVDDKKTSESLIFNRNFYLGYDSMLTNFIGYRIFIRTNWLDSRITDASDNVNKNYRREIEPTLDIYFRNPIYYSGFNYRRLDTWSTANLSNKGRLTSENIYFFINFNPKDFPTLNFNYNRQSNYDYLSEHKINNIFSRYSFYSQYSTTLLKKVLFNYNISYSHGDNRDKVSLITRNKLDKIYSNINLNYNQKITEYIDLNTYYFNSIAWNKNQVYSKEESNMTLKRSTSHGFYSIDSTYNETTYLEKMQLLNSLIDGLYNPIDELNLSLSSYLNIGVDLSFIYPTTVSIIRIYVNNNLDSEINLLNPYNWAVLYAMENPTTDGLIFPVAWFEVPIINVTKGVDSFGNNYFEIKIADVTPKYIKVVNKTAANTSNLKVTEMEVYGVEPVKKGWSDVEGSNYNHRFGVNLNYKLSSRVLLNIYYSVDKTELNPSSISTSFNQFFKNILSNKLERGEKDYRANLSRGFGVSSTILFKPNLTSTIKFQRTKSLDNQNATDNMLDTYTFTINYIPLSTLVVNLSAIRSELESFGNHTLTSDSVFLSINARLLNNLSSITESGYLRSLIYQPKSENKSFYFRERIDSYLTKSLYFSILIDLNKYFEPHDELTKSLSFSLNYRPGRLFTISSLINYADTRDGSTYSQGLILDWAPVPVLRLNLGWDRSKQVLTRTNNLRGYVMWQISRYMNLHLGVNYSRATNSQTTENYYFTSTLTWNF